MVAAPRLPDQSPSILDQIAQACGGDVARQLCAAFGGTRLYVAKNPSAKSRLAQAIGIDAARALAKHFDTMTLTVPRDHVSRVNERHGAIMRMTGEGRSAGSIAGELGVCIDTVFRVRRTMRAARGR